MELAGVPSDDRNAGYIDEDESEIEYSDFEEGDWDFDRLGVAYLVYLTHTATLTARHFF